MNKTRHAFPARRRSVIYPLAALSSGALVLALSSVGPVQSARSLLGRGPFSRIATYYVSGSLAEIVAATPDGNTLIYADADEEELGFVDITDPAAPQELATVPLAGEPTSVAVHPNGLWALACVNLPDFSEDSARFNRLGTQGGPSPGTDELVVVNLANRTIERSIPLNGQPDAVAISKDGKYAAVAIENERNEDLNDGEIPQSPAGFLTIVDIDSPGGVGGAAANNPDSWTTREVDLSGLTERFPSDPEPEFVDINDQNQAAVTLQENNHIVIVDLADGSVIRHFSAGTTTHEADTVEDDNVRLVNRITNSRREPDAIQWTPQGNLMTANEGDYDLDLSAGQFVGTRDFTVFNAQGKVLFQPGAGMERLAILHGHYPDDRSRNKGIEPEGVEIATFGGQPLAFVGSERGNFVAVYRIANEQRPQFLQLLATGASPEGLLAIPQRNLFVTANEDEPGSISIFRYGSPHSGNYPDVTSYNTPWSALSGFYAQSRSLLYAVPDSAVRPSRIYRMLLHRDQALVLGALPLAKNYDLEGIASNPRGGGWWVVSEGAGNAPSASTPNLLVQVRRNGTIAREIQLPDAANAEQRSSGFEGVATNRAGTEVYVAFQREWAGDPTGLVRIGRYTPATGQWAFYHYPLDTAQVQGAWVGLSEITRIDDTTFAVIERDNQAGPAARIKRIYKFSVANVTPAPHGSSYPVLTKTLVRDILTEDGLHLEKHESLAYLGRGEAVLANDNDGSGETQLVRFRAKF